MILTLSCLCKRAIIEKLLPHGIKISKIINVCMRKENCFLSRGEIFKVSLNLWLLSEIIWLFYDYFMKKLWLLNFKETIRLKIDCLPILVNLVIHFIYCLANGNGHATVPLYGEGYPATWQLNHQTFTLVHQNLTEHGFFIATIKGTGWSRTARALIFEEGVLHTVDGNSGTSARALAIPTGRYRAAHIM